MASIYIPIVGSLTGRNNSPSISDTADQQFINCFPEIIENPVTKKAEVLLTKRVGFSQSALISGAAPNGSYAGISWDPSIGSTKAVFAFQRTNAIAFIQQDLTQVGSNIATTAALPFCFDLQWTTVSGTNYLTANISDGGTAEWWFYPNAGAWTQIVSANFPANTQPPHAHMDGYMFVMDQKGAIYNGDVNSLANWTASSFLTVSGGGMGLGVVKYRNFIVGFTDYSIEFFRNAGNPAGSVLSRVDGGVIRLGSIYTGQSAPFKVIGDSIYVIGHNPDSAASGVYRITGMQSEKISNDYIDRLLNIWQFYLIVGAMQLGGKTHIVFSGGAVTTALCYCLDTKSWWLFKTTSTASFGAVVSTFSAGAGSVSSFVGPTLGRVLTFTTTSPDYTDATVAFSMSVQTGNMDLRTTKRKFWKRLGVVGDYQSAASAVSVSSSDDDYTSFSAARDIDMNVIPTPRLHRLGSSRRRAWKLTHSANTACRLYGMEIDYEVGSH